MPSFEQAVVNNSIIIEVSLKGEGEERVSYSALLDTGATGTAISPKVVTELGLTPVGTSVVTVASGESHELLQYRARVDIPIGYHNVEAARPLPFLYGDDLIVAGLPYQPRSYDVILGMDLIRLFHMTMYGDRIILSN